MEWAGRLIGVFYAVAGLVALRQMVVCWRLEALFGKYLPTQPAERAADLILTLGSVLVLVSGVLLTLLHSWAVAAFVVCWLVQAAYLLWAQRWHPPENEESAGLRRQTLHAFTGYTIATAVVMALDHRQILV